MNGWTGWQLDFLAAAQLPQVGKNAHFLTDWADNAYADCQFNPIDLSQVNPDSHDCKAFRDKSGRQYQKYDSHTAAAGGFAAQIGRNDYAGIRAALASGDPYVVSDVAVVAAEIKAWGSSDFAAIYDANAQPPPKNPKNDAQTLGGWKDIRHSFNRTMPNALRSSKASRKHALRSLSRASRVKL